MEIYYIITYERESGVGRQTKGIVATPHNVEVRAALLKPVDLIQFCYDPWKVVDIEPVGPTN